MELDTSDHTVHIVSAFSDERICTLELPGTASVLQVKQALAAALGVTRFCQHLLLGATQRPFDDRDSLSSLALDADLKLHEPISLKLVRLAFSCGDDGDAGPRLVEAAREGQLDAVEQLLKVPVRPDFAGVDGRTPLFGACERGHLEVVRLLCEAAADAGLAVDGVSPMAAASQAGHSEIVRLLCEAGADKDGASQQGRTPLGNAAEEGHIEVVRVLCGAGADTDRPGLWGLTPLDLAAYRGRQEVVQLLCEAGAGGGCGSVIGYQGRS